MQDMSAFFRFRPVNRGLFAFVPPSSRSRFLSPPPTAGLWDQSQKRLLCPFFSVSLRLRVNYRPTRWGRTGFEQHLTPENTAFLKRSQVEALVNPHFRVENERNAR